MLARYKQFVAIVFLAPASILGTAIFANAQTRITVGVTETIETYNPYGDSVSLLYGIWSEITGPFCTYNYSKGDFEGRLAEKWKVENTTTWIFSLNKNYRFNDGSPVTAEDVVHSIVNRVIKDPQSKQKASVAPSIVNAEAIDKFTVKVTTHKPTAPLLSFFCDRLIITSKAMFDKYGRDAADKDHMIGAGPYRLKELIPKMVGEERFIEIYVDTPIEVCEQRDVKGLYARARRGQITGFTGVDDPYETPVDPEITLYTVETSAEENARKVIAYLEEHGFLLPDGKKNVSEKEEPITQDQPVAVAT